MANLESEIMFSESGLNTIMTAQIGEETAETFRDEASFYEDEINEVFSLYADEKGLAFDRLMRLSNAEINQAIMYTRKTSSYASLGRMIDLLLDSDERNLCNRIASGDLDDDEMM
jgi:hypothetical protein